MDQRLIIASNNKIKSEELITFFKAFNIAAVWYRDLIEKVEFPVEGESSYYDNALIKAQFLQHKLPKEWIVADDSGMELHAFPNKYGILTARQLRQETNFDDDDVLNDYLVQITDKSGDRAITMRTALVVLSPAGKVYISHGSFTGELVKYPSHHLNQGFDPLLFVPKLGKTFAELSVQESLKWQHRAIAVKQMADQLEEQ
ncbi:non-canonical purine NTP pyrophosphatase [Pediococcus claussenii]|uniref:Non-canonical purine NTP pyrophosphatase, RdgB/HAM1 family n=1 Tax=Pediococcus claussenii (strain ATCC BAA-344 / DSM 14800 / JCM 18046 / KCTC 3811 / LMG 21948 / P06) TaxID=701521 RepID=G8PDL3_PEDCP|nr:non-canonical purine NTP pyrophosphatase [Pediococcus claussenii]AEV95348.1 Non-canonical purine NTP pyrophosphatase, RdgB/HAM1 family [Pediococcus claussenii ATCC BAA-344]ANZ68880.1 hypothetical protein AYR57_00455 [Pediococcus claussenii]ANZ70696.1 hypothetical protein AYR58_00455 [Pediococcus claussenii]KRN18991.1 rdgB protein [Pediococcus claussenii]